jgi:preprotein translocase subunit SecA
MPGRRWSDGLHQAVEAKEAVKIERENQTLATITFQNYFRKYKKLSGMTGTAETEAAEFGKIYSLDVNVIPTNRPLRRVEEPDLVYRTEAEKWNAIVEDIVARQNEGRPTLVGTVSIEKSERLSGMLKRRGIKHIVLNAKYHAQEAEIVAQAGRRGGITIATNMAGRGTDILLGGNAEHMARQQALNEGVAEKLPRGEERFVDDDEFVYFFMVDTFYRVKRADWERIYGHFKVQCGEEHEDVVALGGLHILGTERHEARRIDLQLRGRCGRQGDPGSSRFYLSLEDDLMRIFAGEWVKNLLTRLGMQEGEAIESRMVSRRIEGAQKKVEERNFEVRKNLLEYDEVMDEQRKRVYRYRQRILDGVNCRDLITEMIAKQVEENLNAAAAGNILHVQLDPKDFRNTDFKDAQRIAVDEANRMAESQILDAIEENLPDDEDQSEWNWAALATTMNTRWGLNLRDRDLKKIGREDLSEELMNLAHHSIERVDLSPTARFLEPDFGVRTACAWLRDKFGVEMSADEAGDLEPAQVGISGPRRLVSLLGPRRRQPAARLFARGPRRMGQAAVRCRALGRRPQEQTARRYSRGIGRAQPPQ